MCLSGESHEEAGVNILETAEGRRYRSSAEAGGEDDRARSLAKKKHIRALKPILFCFIGQRNEMLLV